MIRFKQISKLLAAIICLVICNSVHGQSVGFNAYELKIDGATNGPTFRLSNKSTNGNRIANISIRVNRPGYAWDLGHSSVVNRDNVSSASINSSTRRTQLAELTFTGFNSGESVIFTLDPDTASNDAVVDYRDILIANPDNDITPGVVRITFSNGEAESFELTSSDGTRNNPVRYTQGFNDFSNGAKNLNDGTTIRGADARILNGRLRFTSDGNPINYSTFTIPPLHKSSQGFQISFDYLLRNTEGLPADGFSINYGNASGAPATAQELGIQPTEASENLAFTVRTYSPDKGLFAFETVSGNRQSKAELKADLLPVGTRQGTVTIRWKPSTNTFDYITTGLANNANFRDQPLDGFVGNDAYSFIIGARVGAYDQTFEIDNLDIFTTTPSEYKFEGPYSTLDISSLYSPSANINVNTGAIAVPKTKVTINGNLIKEDIGAKFSLKVLNGDQVVINAPQYVYYDSNDGVISPDNALDQSLYRFKANGMTVVGEPSTGNATNYSFVMNSNKSVKVQWDKQFALQVNNKIDLEKSDLIIGTSPWAGPVPEKTSGNPSYSHGKHFVDVDRFITFEIDGAINDPVRQSLPVRYVVESYCLKDQQGNKIDQSGNSINSNISFPGATSQQPSRQQIEQIQMDQPKTIELNWKLQYGIQQSTTDSDSQTNLIVIKNPIIDRRIDSIQGTEVLRGRGTYWVDPGGDYFVGTATTYTTTQRSYQVQGWNTGDGFYFESNGILNANIGKVSSQPSVSGYSRSSNNTIIESQWYANQNFAGINYSGVYIQDIQRPARAKWDYGNLAIATDVYVGDYVFEKENNYLANFRKEPTNIRIQGAGQGGADDILNTATQGGQDPSFEWDSTNKVLYALWGSDDISQDKVFEMDWEHISGRTYKVEVTIKWPKDAENKLAYDYPHLVGAPPVNVDPDPDDEHKFIRVFSSTANAVVDNDNKFTATTASTDTSSGVSVLLFSRISRIGVGVLNESLEARIVKTFTKDDPDVRDSDGLAYIGEKITDPTLDQARLGTGYLIENNDYTGDISGDLRINVEIYDHSKWSDIRPQDVYENIVTKTLMGNASIASPGPIFPVNLKLSTSSEIVVGWYDDPNNNDGLLWPHKVKKYTPKWRKESDFTAYDPNIPQPFGKNLKRIVIASQYGSESKDSLGDDQTVVDLDVQNPTTFDPSRFQELKIYNQPDINMPGYNPNEEHAFLAPSLRYADVSPRPDAVYALRNGDLNQFTATDINSVSNGHTSVPRVLVSFYDLEKKSYQMQVYEIKKQADDNESWPDVKSHKFATIPSTPTARTLDAQSHIKMKAGEPVIPFYPLGVAIGAAPLDETFGGGIPIGGNTQSTYWEDHRGSYWAISGGDNAWFKVSFYYPLLPAFWWPDGVGTKKLNAPTTEGSDPTVNTAEAQVPSIGDALSFLPNDYDNNTQADEIKPTEILYKSDWPDTAPTLKAGETLTFSGGEYRSDNPTQLTTNSDGEVVRVNTEGLPGVVGFASAEVIFDSLNPSKSDNGWKNVNTWTARVIQPLEVRKVNLSTNDFPSSLEPAGGETYVKRGKYIFKKLSASLQKRVRYDPLTEKLELIGLLNDKDIGDSTLTAAPPAVYALEPNILTKNDRDELKSLDDAEVSNWDKAIDRLYWLSRNPGTDGLDDATSSSASPGKGTGRISNTDGGKALENDGYYVGLQGKVKRDPTTQKPEFEQIGGVDVVKRFDNLSEPLVGLGPGLAIVPNAGFLDPSNTSLPNISWITVVENNHETLGGSPVTPHIIKVDRRQRYRGSIKTLTSNNVFDENINLQHTGEFGANTDDLVFEWWYRIDDGSQNVPPPNFLESGGPWYLYPDQSGQEGRARFKITIEGSPNAPEALIADTFWFCRYRHKKEIPESPLFWKPYGVDTDDDGEKNLDKVGAINFEWAGAGNSQPLVDADLDGLPDYRAQLVMGWIKRVMDAVNPYEARIKEFDSDVPSTVVSMLAQLGQRYEGAVALNPDKNVIENVGLIELYRTILERAKSLTIDLSRPISSPAIANALQLASSRLGYFYTLLGNEAYADALDPTIGFGSDSVDAGSFTSGVHAFQNQTSSLLEEELALLRGVDDYFARPVYNRLFWNFTKAEGEAAYAMNYNLSDVNMDGFINEDDAMLSYPQGHGDAWGHYLSAMRHTYELLSHPYFNWVSRSESYNLQDIVIDVDFLDERKFASTAAAKAKAGKEIVENTYRSKYVEIKNAQWQGYTDDNADRAWGVEGWSRRAAQGAYFDWVTANALLPAVHPNESLEGIQKVDRASNSDLKVISANLNSIQSTFDNANNGYNPLGIPNGDSVMMDFDPTFTEVGSGIQGEIHFDQMYKRAEAAIENAQSIWERANEPRNMIRQVNNTEAEFRNSAFQEDLAYKNQLIQIFGKPYEGTIGSGKFYPAGYDGPDLALYMYADQSVREISHNTVPLPTTDYASFDDDGKLTGGSLLKIYTDGAPGRAGISGRPYGLAKTSNSMLQKFAPTFAKNNGTASFQAKDNYWNVNYTDMTAPKVPLDGLADAMPVTAGGYTFQAPQAWGKRTVSGELQMIIIQMIQKEAEVAEAIADWDALTGEIQRQFHVIQHRFATGAIIKAMNTRMALARFAWEKAKDIGDLFAKTLEKTDPVIKAVTDSAQEMFPKQTPIAGLAIGPGDVLAPARGGVKFTYVGAKSVMTTGEILWEASKLSGDTFFDFGEVLQNNDIASLESTQGRRESLKELEDLVGDEAIKRVSVFKELQALKELGDQYVFKLDEGARLIDEREHFNKQVAASVQRERYQDMNFRIARNHALRNYKDSLNLAAKYAYMAGKAYEFETNLPIGHEGSVIPLLNDIVKSRGLGPLNKALSKMSANYEVLRGQLGVNNPQFEFSEMSLRTEQMRILPKNFQVTSSDDQNNASSLEFNNISSGAEAQWQAALTEGRVADLWDVREYRNYCRPFAPRYDASGTAIKEPGIVLRFETEVTPGKNFFGRPLAGGDHTYDPSNYSTKIRAAAITFDDYLSDNVLNDLSDSPRVYLIPVGSDVISYPVTNPSDNSVAGLKRFWDVVDQKIPLPFPATSSTLDRVDYNPIIDNINDRFGNPRRFSSFRVKHSTTGSVDDGTEDSIVEDSRLVGRSVANTKWVLIIPGRALYHDGEVGLDRFINNVSDIKLYLDTYGFSGG